ncbi:MAG: AAA family ATPase [Planctomycetota bacterium]
MGGGAFLRRVELRRSAVPAFDRYPFCLPVVRGLEVLELHPQVTFLIGENGSGKSTLLEALAVSLGFNAEGGSRNFAFATRASHSELHEFLLVARGPTRPRTGFFLRAESFFNVATEVERIGVADAYGARALHEQSHGEAFLSLFLHRFQERGLYLLDEPEAALSPQRQLAVLARLHQLVQGGAQFVIATHSPILMAYPFAAIWHCGDRGLERVDYRDTEHYRVTRGFLSDPEGVLRLLLAPDDDPHDRA